MRYSQTQSVEIFQNSLVVFLFPRQWAEDWLNHQDSNQIDKHQTQYIFDPIERYLQYWPEYFSFNQNGYIVLLCYNPNPSYIAYRNDFFYLRIITQKLPFTFKM